MSAVDILAVTVWVVIPLGIALLVASILLDYAKTSARAFVRDNACPVNTGSIAAFIVCVVLLIWFRVGMLRSFHGAAVIVFVIVGLCMYAAGAVVNLLARRQLGLNWSNRIRVYRDHTLVTTGVYGAVRHPIYSSIILMLFGAAFVYMNLLVLALITVVLLPAMVYRARKEEEMLREEISAYTEYSRKVPMLFPRIWRRRKRG